MRIKWLITITAIIICAAYMTWDMTRPPARSPLSDNQENSLAVQAPNFWATLINGETITLADHEGKVVMINFWASWCPPCVAEFPDIMRVAEAYPEELVVIALSVDENREEAKRFLDKLDTPLPPNMLAGYDTDKTVSKDLFQTVKYPETYILKPDLTIDQKIEGVFDWQPYEFGLYLESLK